MVIIIAGIKCFKGYCKALDILSAFTSAHTVPFILQLKVRVGLAYAYTRQPHSEQTAAVAGSYLAKWWLACIENVCVWNEPIVCPPLLTAFCRTAHTNNFTLNTALPWVLSKTPTEGDVDRMNSCRDAKKDRQTETPS